MCDAWLIWKSPPKITQQKSRARYLNDIYTPIGKPHMVELFAIAAKEEANTSVYKNVQKDDRTGNIPRPRWENPSWLFVSI